MAVGFEDARTDRIQTGRKRPSRDIEDVAPQLFLLAERS
jgi:hypothetical protein